MGGPFDSNELMLLLHVMNIAATDLGSSDETKNPQMTARVVVAAEHGVWISTFS